MLASPPRQGERAAALGKELGVTVGETMPSFGFGRPAVQGATGELARALKEAGGRWSSKEKAIVLHSWIVLESLLAGRLEVDRSGESP